MTRRIWLVSVFGLLATTAAAQTPVPIVGTEMLEWDYPTPVAEAQALEYVPTVNEMSTPPAESSVALAGVVCEATTATSSTCRARILALPPGLSEIRLWARRRVDATRALLSEGSSPPLLVATVMRPIAPSTLRMVVP